MHYLLARSTILQSGSSAVNANGANASVVLFEDAITGTNTGVAISNGAAVFGSGNSEIFGNGTNVSGGTISELPPGGGPPGGGLY